MRRALWLSLATALTVLCSAASLSTLVAPQVWLGPATAGLLFAWGILSLVRRWQAGMFVPTLAALAGSAGLVTAWFASTDALLGFIPTRDSSAYLYHLFLAGTERLWNASPPIEHAQGVGLVVMAGLLIAYLLADLVAVSGRAPAWALVPALAVWAGPVAVGEPVSMVWVAASGVGAAAMIAADGAVWSGRRQGVRQSPAPSSHTPSSHSSSNHSSSSSPRARRSRARGITLIGATACTVAIALVAAPALLLLPTPIEWHPPSGPGVGNATNLDLGLNLREDLRRPEPQVVITYEGMEPAQLGPLHAYTLTTFNGTSWEHTEAEQWRSAEGEYLWPGPFEATSRGSVTISIQDLEQDRLPVPGEPRRVQAQSPLSYSPRTDEVRLTQPVSGSFRYELDIRQRDLDPDRLANLDPREANADPALLQLPDTGYTDRIADLTQDVVADAGSAYQQLVAIQNYLRDPALFTYTESITSGDTPDAVWDFLQDRRGYCVQFATTMIIMARTLGIPSRMAIGYLPGEQTEDGTVQIASDKAHAWPQVLFPEVGWVRFEPTPGVQSGQAPQWAPAAAEQTDTAGTSPTSSATSSTPSPTESESGSSPASEESSSGASAAATSGAYWWVAVALAVLLVTGVALWWRRKRQVKDLETAWRQAESLIRAAGGDLGPGATVRQRARSASRVLNGEAALKALGELASAVEMQRYAIGHQPPSAVQLREWIATIRSDSAVPVLRRWAERIAP